jgi:heme-degrading monooxygenase HmoA
MIGATPTPPYTAVIFSSLRVDADDGGYGQTAIRMESLAQDQPGYVGIESVRDPSSHEGITVSYYTTEADAQAWKAVTEHVAAQRLGRERWYDPYRVRVATVTREYGRS